MARAWSAGRLACRCPVWPTRHATCPCAAICVEGRRAIDQRGGDPFAEVLRRVRADMTANCVDFRCADGHHMSIDMAAALHPQSILALDRDGAPLPAKYGYPVKLRIPTKLGYKNPKHIHTVVVRNNYPGGYWEDQGHNWIGGS